MFQREVNMIQDRSNSAGREGNGFVSNSSSASFVLQTASLSTGTIAAILDHIHLVFVT